VYIGDVGASQLVACVLSARVRLLSFSNSYLRKMTFPVMCFFIFCRCITKLLKVCSLLLRHLLSWIIKHKVKLENEVIRDGISHWWENHHILARWLWTL